MATANGGRWISSICSTYTRATGCNVLPTISLQVRGYAARKGTREKARKAKVKVEAKKIGFIPHNQRILARNKKLTVSKRIEDLWKPVSTDDVWMSKFYQWRVFPFADAVEAHRETHHPTVGNAPNTPLVAFVELDMRAEKKNKFVDNFTSMVAIPHPIPLEKERIVLALCKTDEQQKLAIEAGAALSGGSDIVKQIINGDISLDEYDFVVGHPNILPEIASLRGIMRKKFPSVKTGNLDADIVHLVKKFTFGIEYKAFKDEQEEDYGTIKAVMGPLSMDPAHLEANFSAFINDVYSKKPKRNEPFITRTRLITANSLEQLKVDHEKYLPAKSEDKSAKDNDDDEEYDPHTVAAASSL